MCAAGTVLPACGLSADVQLRLQGPEADLGRDNPQHDPLQGWKRGRTLQTSRKEVLLPALESRILRLPSPSPSIRAEQVPATEG